MKSNKPIDWTRVNAARAKSVKKYQAKRLEKLKNKKQKINNTSTQRALLNKVYAILIKELKPLHTLCEAGLPGCTVKTTQVHHKKGRRGLLLILSKYFGYQCDNCHKFCTIHSKVARDMGLSLPINSNTEYDFTDREKELIEKYGIRLPGNINIA